MSEIMTPGAPTIVPAGYAAQSLTGGLPSLQLSANVAAADVIEFTGALTAQDIVVVLPQPLFPSQVVGSNLGGSFSGPTSLGWSKIIRNSTTGSFMVRLQALAGPNRLLIPQGGAMWVYSPDGFSVFAGAQSTSGVVGAIGLAFVFRPGAVAPLQPNVYTTWTTLAAAVTATLTLARGPVTIVIDDSLAATTVDPGTWFAAFPGQIYLLGVPSDPSVLATLHMPAGTQIAEAIAGAKLLNFTCSPTAALPSLKWSASGQVFIEACTITNLAGDAHAVQIAGGLFGIFSTDFTFFNGTGTAGGEMFQIAAGATLIIDATQGAFFQPASNVVASAVGGNFRLNRASGAGTVVKGVNCLGSFNIGFFEQGPTTEVQTIATGPVTLTIDAQLLASGNAAEELIFCRGGVAAAVNLQLPDPTLAMNKGRRITVVDGNGSSAVTPIVLMHFGATTLNGAAADKNLQSNWGIWTVVCDGAQWIVAQAAGI
jgi:hypothetical protein